MRRNTFNFLVDLVSLLVMLAMVCTGLVMRYTLPPGSGGRGGGRGLVLWGLDRHSWGSIHFWLSLSLLLLLVVHLVLHWSWVCGTIRCWLRVPGRASPRARTLYGAGCFIALLMLVGEFFWLTRLQVEELAKVEDVPASGHGPGIQHGPKENLIIRGQMTLNEVARGAAMTTDALKALLNLPPDTPGDERLGRLRRLHGLQMPRVRRLVGARGKR